MPELRSPYSHCDKVATPAGARQWLSNKGLESSGVGSVIDSLVLSAISEPRAIGDLEDGKK